MTLVIVHIPKAAGTSLRDAIAERVGADNIHPDYNRPLAKRDLHRKLHCLMAGREIAQGRAAVIFGHFMVGKYARFAGFNFAKKPGFRYVIFLRDPLQRALSHYFFWERTYLGGHRVWDRFNRENWSLERFLLSGQHTNFQSKFIWRFPLSQFDFVGLAEHYADSLTMLGRAFPILSDLRVKSENNNPDKSGGANYHIDAGLALEFRHRNTLDYTLYTQALECFGEQKTTLLPGGAGP